MLMHRTWKWLYTGEKWQSILASLWCFKLHHSPASLDSVNSQDFWCVVPFSLSVSRQHSGLCRVRLRHGGGGQHLHGALQGAEISRLHLDAVSRGEGSQAKVWEQFINHSVHTHARTHTLPLFIAVPRMHYLTSPLPRATASKKGAPYRQMKHEIILQMAA